MKSLRSIIQTLTNKDNKYWYNNSIICSIEEQNEWEFAEHNSNDKTKTEFKIDDWITFYGGEPFKILKVEREINGTLDYLLLPLNGNDSYFNKKYVDENARLFTIQDAISLLKKQSEQKPWSEEDKKMKSLIISTLTSMGTINLERYYHMNLDEVKNWFESIKDRVQPQPKQEWSEEDEAMLLHIKE